MKNNEGTMTSKVLRGYSKIIAGLGIVMGGYLIITNFKNVRMLAISSLIIFGAGLLAAVVRMLGNVGRMMFEFTGFQYVQIMEIKNQIKALNGSLAQMHGDLKVYLQPLKEDCLHIKNNSAQIKHDCTQIKNDCIELKNNSVQIKDDCRELEGSVAQIRGDCMPIKDNCMQIKDDCMHLKDHAQQILGLKDDITQIGCDCKDASQNIYQLKTFFEQIEKHLDLNE